MCSQWVHRRSGKSLILLITHLYPHKIKVPIDTRGKRKLLINPFYSTNNMPPYSNASDSLIDLNSSYNSLDFRGRKESSRPTFTSHKRHHIVQFTAFDDIVEIPHVNDMEDDEINDVWFSPEEMQAIRNKCKQLVTKMNETNKITERGLECHTADNLKQRTERKNQVYEAVLETQYTQRLQGIEDAEEIARLCMQFSEVAHLEGHVVGLCDAVAVQRERRIEKSS